MKEFPVICVIILLIVPFITAIRINEVELNPTGTDAGNEWVEFYSEEEVNLGDYRLVNNDGDFIELETSFSGYYVYTFNKQWLDNNDEKVFLYKNDDLIDETDLLKDDDNDNSTWQFCSNSWEFLKATKSEDNECGDIDTNDNEEIIEEQNETINQTQSNESQEEVKEENIKETKSENVEVIELNTKAIKTEDDKENSDKGKLAMYGFVTFSIMLGILFMLKKRKIKNEFEE